MDYIGWTSLSIMIILAGTTLGSAFVFFFRKKPSDRSFVISLGFASGIMVAAAFFGLINPSVIQSKANYPINLAWLPPLAGFILGGLLLYGIDKLVPHIHKDAAKPEGLAAPELSKNFKFFLAVTIHNIPEGLVTGFACGLALANQTQMSYCYSAFALALGIAIQNIPEGFAISVPMYSSGMSKWKSFFYGMASGLIEPIMAVGGMFIAANSAMAMPWLLSFGAGAMLYVTVDELLPDAHKPGYEHNGLWAFMIGFGVMMVLETIL